MRLDSRLQGMTKDARTQGRRSAFSPRKSARTVLCPTADCPDLSSPQNAEANFGVF